jgi:predicted PilT family ATPase
MMSDMWVFGDGTTLELGGEVTGESDVANILRHHLKTARLGVSTVVAVGPHPRQEQVDPSNPVHLDALAREVARQCSVEVTGAPWVAYPVTTSLDGLVY